ncbi:MAG: hypothetical protein U5K37_05375 [Natrialbaceae archaeon]|nr:hypothetical protein [Natrialbaceae archaeon]
MAVIAAIHDLDHAARYCDRLVLLEDGRVKTSGDPAAVLSGENIASTFGVTDRVSSDAFLGSPRITALREPPVHDLPASVHVLGASEMASRVVATLGAAGIDVSVGPIVATAPTVAVAEEAGCETIVVDPFEPIASREREQFEAAIAAAEATVIADLELSAGIRELLSVIPTDQPTVLIESDPVDDGSAAYDDLRKSGHVTTSEDWLGTLERVPNDVAARSSDD